MARLANWLGSKLLTNTPNRNKKKKLHYWLDEYVKGKGTAYATAHNAGFVNDFIYWLDEDLDLYEVTENIIYTHLDEYYTGYDRVWRSDARKAINSWLRYWRNRGFKMLPQVYFNEGD